MITSAKALSKYGSPLDDARTADKNETTEWERRNMAFFNIPTSVTTANKVIPKRIYANKDFGQVVINWLVELTNRGLIKEINEWNGIYSIRLKRGLSSLSLHSYAIAVDVNARNNPLGLTREQCIKKGLTPFSPMFIDISRQFMDCGADWKSRPDGMHYQLKSL